MIAYSLYFTGADTVAHMQVNVVSTLITGPGPKRTLIEAHAFLNRRRLLFKLVVIRVVDGFTA